MKRWMLVAIFKSEYAARTAASFGPVKEEATFVAVEAATVSDEVPEPDRVLCELEVVRRRCLVGDDE